MARWTNADKERLALLHNGTPIDKRSQTFFENLTEAFGGGRSVSSIQEQCRRQGLKPKKPPVSPFCISDGCDAILMKDNRVGNVCQTCYNRNWYRAHKNQ